MDYRLQDKKENVTIKVIWNQYSINVNEQLEYLNLLYLRHVIKKYGFNNFFVTKIRSIKPNDDSTSLFF